MQFYQQTTDATHAAASLMLMLNHFKGGKFEISKENEFHIWHRTATLPTKVSNIFALAMLAKKEKLKVSLIVGDIDYRFSNDGEKKFTKKEIYQAKYMNNLFYQKAKQKMKIEQRVFKFQEVKDWIKNGKILLLRLNIGILDGTNNHLTKYFLVHGYGNDLFLINDTREGENLRVKEGIFKEAFETVKSKCKKDNQVIIFDK